MVPPPSSKVVAAVPGAKCIVNGSKCFFEKNKTVIAVVAGVVAVAAITYGVWYTYYQGGNNQNSRRRRRRVRSQNRLRGRSSSGSSTGTAAASSSKSDVDTARPACTPVPPKSSVKPASSDAAPSSKSPSLTYAAVAAKELYDQKTQEDSHDKQ